MPCRGVFHALTVDQAGLLLDAEGDREVLGVLEEIMKTREEAWAAPVDKTWDAMHRALSNGTLYHDEGEYPLNCAVLGGEHLYDADDYIVSYVAAEEVKDVAEALAPLTEKDFRARYDAIDPDEYDGEHGETDFQATWGYLQAVRGLYQKAAVGGRSMVFKVDQ